MSWTSAFNEATFGEIFLSSLGSINDYVRHIYRKYADPDRKNIACRPEWKEVVQCK